MNTTTDFFARRLVMTLLAVLTTTMAWAQLNGSGTEDDPYLISSVADWTTFTESINKGVGTDCFYMLTDDITLGTEESPITTVVGHSKKISFNGTFDGCFHTIHLNMYRDVEFAAPFGVTNGATIKNLTVDGTIETTNKFAGGIVGYANNDADKTTNIINCISKIHIICDDIVTVMASKPFDCTHGGLVGQNERGTLNFVNCVFEGSITDSKNPKTANKCTGFVAWVNDYVNYTNCTMAGTIDVKPNDDGLQNSMANFHRLAKNAKAKFIGPSFYFNDYSYNDDWRQGQQAYVEIPENAISKIYTFDETTYYVPGEHIHGYEVSYYGKTLVEGTDYLINKELLDDGIVMTVRGINGYVGSVTKIIKDYEVKVCAWDATEKTGWVALSSPIQEQKFSEVENLQTMTHNIYRYDESQRMWQEYRNPANMYDEFESGRGYIYRTLDNGGTIVFNGAINTGDVEYTLSKSSKSDKLNGFNLIGNPYMHQIYKGVSIPSKNLENGYCVLTEKGTWEFKTDKEAINVCEAVLVQSKAVKTIVIKDNSDAPTKRADNDDIWFTVSNGEFTDVAHVEFQEGRGFNKMSHYNEDAPMLYVIRDGENFTSVDLSDDTGAIGLGFEAKTMGRYTLRVKANGAFDYLHLIDRMTGTDVDMLIEDEYSFIGSANDNADRFIVKLRDVSCSSSIDENFVWQNGSDIIVSGNGELQVFDLTGRMIMNMNVNGIETVSASSLPTNVCIFRLLGNEVRTQKVIVK